MLTSNLPFSKWEQIFKDAMTTAAASDRLVHHSVILAWNVPSYRLENAKKPALPHYMRYFSKVVASTRCYRTSVIRRHYLKRQMSYPTRQEVLTALRERYLDASRAGKSKILDEFVALTGAHRKHAIRVLCRKSVVNEKSETQPGRRVYDDVVGEALAALQKNSCEGLERKALSEFLEALPKLWNEGEVRPTHQAKPTPKRTWRTRHDPFENDWPIILEGLESAPNATAKCLLARLLKENPDKYHQGQLRTLQRRVKQWSQLMAKKLVYDCLPDEIEATAVCNGGDPGGQPPDPRNLLGERQLRIDLPRGFLGLIVMSYLGRDSDRSRRQLICCISRLLADTSSVYGFSR